MSGIRSLSAKQTRESQLSTVRRWAAGDPHWAFALTCFLYEGEEMPREIDLAKAAREFVTFVCLLFRLILSGEPGNVYFGIVVTEFLLWWRWQTDPALVLVSAM